MADELDQNLSGGDGIDHSRLKELSNKVKITSEERDEKAKLLDEASKERDAAKKEVEFYSSFTDSVSKYPQAKDHKDEIKEK